MVRLCVKKHGCGKGYSAMSGKVSKKEWDVPTPAEEAGSLQWDYDHRCKVLMNTASICVHAKQLSAWTSYH